MKILILLLSTIFMFGCASIADLKQSNSIAGEWNLERETLIIGDESYTTFDGENRTMVKIFTDSHFAFTSIGEHRPRFTSYQLTDSQKVLAFDNFGGAMGRYTFENGILTEHIEFSSFPNYEGVSIPFKITIDGNKMIQEGRYPLVELGLGQQDGYMQATFTRVD